MFRRGLLDGSDRLVGQSCKRSTGAHEIRQILLVQLPQAPKIPGVDDAA